ncbi:MAG: MCE family protein [Ideonella sp.]|nr:MCE family protein [Ideonella sp.]
MEDKVNTALVGAFVLVLGAALVAGVLWLAAGFDGRQRTLPYQSIVPESVAGLSLDAPVKYLGVDVGKVSAIAIDPGNSRQVRLRFLIEQGTPIKQDTEAVLKTQGLTGIAYVELSGGSPGSPPLLARTEGEVPLIRSKPSLNARLENVLSNVLANLDRTSANINAVFDADNRAALKQTLADTATVVHAIAAQQRALGQGIADAAVTARHTAKASEQLGAAIGHIASSAQAVERMADTAAHASDRAGRSIDEAASGVRQIGRETLPELQRAVAELVPLAGSLRHLVEQTERSPSSLLVGRSTRPAGPGEKATP